MTASTSTAVAEDRGKAAVHSAKRQQTKRRISEAGLLGVTGLVFLVLFAASPSFRDPTNLLNILQQNSIYGIVACGMLVMIISGGFDLSVGATGAAATVATAYLSSTGLPPWICILAALGVGLVVGIVNGVVIGRVKINPFIATLGTNSIILGLLFVITGAQPFMAKQEDYYWLGLDYTWGIPNAFLIFMGCAILTWFILTKTKFGHYVFSVGGNEYASMLSGVGVVKTKMIVFTYGAVMASVAGLVLIGQTGTGQPGAAADWPLATIAICVVGGAALSGGQGRVRDVVVATLLLGMITNGLNQLGVSTYWQPVVTGFVILVAVVMDRSKR